MQTTTEFRSHWIDAAGRCYEQCHPFAPGQLSPVVNLDEVRAWLALATTSNALRRSGFPGSFPDDPSRHGMQLVLDLVESGTEIPDHLARALGKELTDDVPRYHQSSDADWRTPFVQMRGRWPLPALGGVCEIRNLTPHVVTVGENAFAPSGTVARAIEEPTAADPIRISVRSSGAPADLDVGFPYDVPTTTMRYVGLVDLPILQPGVYLIVSHIVMQVAAAQGRWTGDLLVPGEQARDTAGRVVGCRSLARAGRPGALP